MAVMSMWRLSTRFYSRQSILLVGKYSSSAPFSLIRFCLSSTLVERSACATPAVTNPTPRLLSARLYSTDIVDGEKITFEEYRKLRKSLKIRGRVAGLPMALVGMGISSFINVQYNPDMFNMTPEEVQPILGMDPIVFSALCGVASGIAGYIVGGALFHVTWRFLYKQKARALQDRENDFLERTQKYRFSESSRYDDDYYAEKVMTLSDYRQWVRQQQRKQEQMQPTAKTVTAADTKS